MYLVYMSLKPHEEEFLQRFVVEGKAVGVPRSASLVMGSLLVCQPKQQTAEQLQKRLGLSAGSVSAALGMLVPIKAVERTKRPGEKRYYYEFLPEGFKRAVEVRMYASRRYVALAELGLEQDCDNERLQAMKRTYEVLEAATANVLKKLP